MATNGVGDVPAVAQEAVLVQSGKLPVEPVEVKGQFLVAFKNQKVQLRADVQSVFSW